MWRLIILLRTAFAKATAAEGGEIMKKGFTLIELLVVISIIGILASLTLVGVSGAQKQARDSQRKSDLGQYRIALEAYAGNNGSKYPGILNGGRLEITVSNLCAAATTTYSLLSYLNDTCLIDPKNVLTCATADYGTPGKKYCYWGDGATDGATSTTYLMYGGLETGGWWEVCSNGKAGKVNVLPASSTCGL